MAWRRRTRRQSSWSRREPPGGWTGRGAAATGRRPHATPNWPRGTSWRATSPAPSHAGRSDRGSSGGFCRRNRILGGGFGRGAKPPSEVLAAGGVAEGDDDERAVGVGGAHAAAGRGDGLGEPAHARHARVHLGLDRRPFVPPPGAEGPAARVRLPRADEPRGV